MDFTITTEALLTQLDYPINENTFEKMENIIENTQNFHTFAKHLLSLKDTIAHYFGAITMSGSFDYLKVKCEEDESVENIKAFTHALFAWSEKYKIELKQVENKPTYYIIGHTA